MTTPASKEPLKNAGVRFPPPLFFVFGFLAGWLIERNAGRLPLTTNPGKIQLLEVVGVVMVVAGLSLVAWGMLTFRAAQTAILPFHPATKIVESGPYRFTRNPMYSGLTTAYLGICWIMNMGWPVIVLPLVLIALHHLVILREERYLESAFGQQYESYRQRVGRWL